MQKNWNKLCSIVKSCKPKMSNQGLRLTALAVLFVMSTGYCLADAGSSAITGAVGTFKGYIQPVRNLLYVIAAVVSIIGAFNVFYKMKDEQRRPGCQEDHHDDHWWLCRFGSDGCCTA